MTIKSRLEKIRKSRPAPPLRNVVIYKSEDQPGVYFRHSPYSGPDYRELYNHEDQEQLTEAEFRQLEADPQNRVILIEYVNTWNQQGEDPHGNQSS